MYEIYINDQPLRLRSSAPSVAPATSLATHLVTRYTGKVKTLLHYADLLEKGSPKVTAVTLYHRNLEQLWTDFKSHYKMIEAAGGVVNLQDTNKYLFIFRRGYLDLPKGKIDQGEITQEAALREVMEETGLKSLSLFPPGSTDPQASRPADRQTFHTYRTKKGKRILKPTYWYRMQTEQLEVEPQIEEDIEWARWLSWTDAMQLSLPFYPSLKCLEELRLSKD